MGELLDPGAHVRMIAAAVNSTRTAEKKVGLVTNKDHFNRATKGKANERQVGRAALRFFRDFPWSFKAQIRPLISGDNGGGMVRVSNVKTKLDRAKSVYFYLVTKR